MFFKKQRSYACFGFMTWWLRHTVIQVPDGTIAFSVNSFIYFTFRNPNQATQPLDMEQVKP
jgi:hypothetical protein